MSNTNNITSDNGQTLAARAASLLSKASAYGIAEKALQQALAAKRVYPALAQDYGDQLGLELPLRTKDFVRVVTNLLVSSEKPLKGVISKRKNQILIVLSDLVGALTDTTPMALPLWALPKERAKTAEAEELREAEKLANAEGALNRANQAAEALAGAALTEAKNDNDNALAKAVAVVVANAGQLTEAQREALMLALASTEAALV
jgi:hypothetical protein